MAMTFAHKIRSERERLGLTQAEAAAILDTSKSIIEKWEAGVRTPKPLMQEGALARLAQEQVRLFLGLRKKVKKDFDNLNA